MRAPQATVTAAASLWAEVCRVVMSEEHMGFWHVIGSEPEEPQIFDWTNSVHH